MQAICFYVRLVFSIVNSINLYCIKSIEFLRLQHATPTPHILGPYFLILQRYVQGQFNSHITSQEIVCIVAILYIQYIQYLCQQQYIQLSSS